MIAYLDSSVLLRIVIGQPDRLIEWDQVERGIVSALSEVECLRAIDRLRLRRSFSDEDLARMREGVFGLLEGFEVVQITDSILSRAAQPMPVELGTLDAVHLATAILWREEVREEPVVATHDRSLALGARGMGFRVVGVS